MPPGPPKPAGEHVAVDVPAPPPPPPPTATTSTSDTSEGTWSAHGPNVVVVCAPSAVQPKRFEIARNRPMRRVTGAVCEKPLALLARIVAFTTPGVLASTSPLTRSVPLHVPASAGVMMIGAH